MSTALHTLITDHNVLQKPTENVYRFFKEHSTLYKVALLVNHLFRAAAMTALALTMPFTIPTNLALCFAGSLFYRLTVETHCAYKFALPAFGGSLAYLTQPPIAPFAIGAYCVYITLTVNHDVNHR